MANKYFDKRIIDDSLEEQANETKLSAYFLGTTERCKVTKCTVEILSSCATFQNLLLCSLQKKLTLIDILRIQYNLAQLQIKSF